jgi:hypothetical protein
MYYCDKSDKSSVMIIKNIQKQVINFVFYISSQIINILKFYALWSVFFCLSYLIIGLDYNIVYIILFIFGVYLYLITLYLFFFRLDLIIYPFHCLVCHNNWVLLMEGKISYKEIKTINFI